jgi:hypothetical protein
MGELYTARGARSVVDLFGLTSVVGFRLGHRSFGEIAWVEPVDLRHVDLRSLARFERGAVTVNVDGLGAGGSGLDGPATVKLLDVWPADAETGRPQKTVDEARLSAHETRLAAMCAQSGSLFLGYDRTTGVWTFLVSSFRRSVEKSRPK